MKIPPFVIKFYDDITGRTLFQKTIADLQIKLNEEWEAKNKALSKEALMQQQYDKILANIIDLQTKLESSEKLRKEDIQKINELIILNQQFLDKLDHFTANSVFKKPCPKLFVPIDPKNVMKFGYLVNCSLGKIWVEYPDRPSIFTPGPQYERVLTEAGVNRQVADLSPIEICTKIANVLQNRIKYKYDKDLWSNYLDNNEPGVVEDLLGYGDCETSAMNIISAIIYYQIKYGAFQDYSVFLGLGYYKGSGGSFGHGFVLVIHDTSTDLKDSYVIEPTAEIAQTGKYTLLSEKSFYGCEWNIVGFVREDYAAGTYAVQDQYVWWSLNKQVGEKIPMMDMFEKRQVPKRGLFQAAMEVVGLRKNPDAEKRKALKEHEKNKVSV